MKLKMISTHEKIEEKTKEITISNHGIIYTITSDFLGICITNDSERITIRSTDDKNKIILS